MQIQSFLDFSVCLRLGAVDLFRLWFGFGRLVAFLTGGLTGYLVYVMNAAIFGHLFFIVGWDEFNCFFVYASVDLSVLRWLGWSVCNYFVLFCVVFIELLCFLILLELYRDSFWIFLEIWTIFVVFFDELYKVSFNPRGSIIFSRLSTNPTFVRILIMNPRDLGNKWRNKILLFWHR